MRSHFYDREGNPLGLWDWSQLFETRREGDGIWTTRVGEQIVSTAWLGIDHRFGLGNSPLIYETMIFPDGDVFGRWPTEAAALAGHDRAVALVQRGNEDDNTWTEQEEKK